MMPVITFRRAGLDDSDTLYDWRNDPATRSASISQDPVPRTDHDRWLAASLASSSRTLLIAETDEREPIATCRFDVEGDYTEVSINLNPAFRGRGLSEGVLRGALDFYREGGASGPFAATIRVNNAASERIFRSVGFEQVGRDDQFGFYRLA